MKRLLFMICLSMTAICLTFAANGTSAHLRFDDNLLSIKAVVLDGVNYSKISLDGFYADGEVGAPMLPVKIVHFSVPYNSEKFKVECNVLSQNRLAVPYLPFPNQQYNADGRDGYITHADPVLYTNSTHNPIVEIVGESYSAGVNKTVAVAVRPVSYDVMGCSVRFACDIDISLSWSIQGDISKLIPRPVIPADMTLVAESAEELKRIVLNPAKVDSYRLVSNTIQKSLANLKFMDNGPYEYIIVTTRSFARAFERLAAYRKSAGYTACVVCIEDVLAHPQFADGDVISDLNDDAGKLRSFLSYAYSNYGTRHVLLGGQIPIRYGTAMPFEANKKIRTPSDLYFGELNNSWRPEGGSLIVGSNIPYYLGTSDIITDYDCEINIGRLTCKSVDDISAFIDKLILYEVNPGLGDVSYLNKAYITVNNNFKQDFDGFVKDKVTKLYNATIVYQDNNYPKGTDVIKHLNNQNFGYVDFQGHGTPESVSTTQNTNNLSIGVYGIQALANEYALGNLADDGEYALNNLNNKTYPHWTYSAACATMPFDIYEDDYTIYELSKNFGESYVMGKEYGGVAFLGYTRNSSIFHANIMYSYFFDYIMSNNLRVPLLGLAEAKSKAFNLYGGRYPKEEHHHVKLAHNLLGDPLTRPWVKVPQRVRYGPIGVNPDDKTYVLTSAINNGSVLAARDIKVGMVRKQALKDKVISSKTIGANKICEIYGNSVLPVSLPLVLQNIEFDSFDYIFTGDVICGSNIMMSQPKGNVVFKKGSDIIIEAAGAVELQNGTILESDAKLTIISKGEVRIGKIELVKGAFLQIHAPSLKLSTPVKFEKGAIFKHDTNIPLYLTK